MLSESRLRELLEPFALALTSEQIQQVLAYLELLLRWNQKINLTSIRDPEACVTRHFGESLFLTKHAELYGTLLDIGSGAGFPGLALKIVLPSVAVTLLEPVAKKRAFLKETGRACGFDHVEVRGERLEEFTRTGPKSSFDFATARAVGKLGRLVPLAAKCLKARGQIFLWLTHDQVSTLGDALSCFAWKEPLSIPLTRSGEIWHGTKQG